ncbi:MAG: hypothetical protein KatS3mg111_0819 [Pirellulaceae bacterium]|nr:MAG: hypothetical protein KatS3mg111_0819 [Pirellulaceae bacterium]
MNSLALIPDMLFGGLLVAAVVMALRSRLVDTTFWMAAMLLSSLITLTTFEPLCDAMRKAFFLPADLFIVIYLWSVVPLLEFSLVLLAMFALYAPIRESTPELEGAAATIARGILGALSGYLLGAFLLIIAQTVPVDRNWWGVLPPEKHRRPGPIMATAPDYQLLTLTEWIAGRRSPITGKPWRLGGPAVGFDLYGERWESFPARYALWREQLGTFLFLSDNLPEDAEQSGDIDASTDKTSPVVPPAGEDVSSDEEDPI